MDINPAEYIPSEEELEEIEFEDKFERGEAKIQDMPIKLYFDNHQELYFDPCALDYIINTIKIKTIGEFVNRYFDILPQVLEQYPFLNQEDVIEHLNGTYDKIFEEVGEMVTIRIGQNN